MKMNNITGKRKLLLGLYVETLIFVGLMFDKVPADIFQYLTMAIAGAVIAGNVAEKFGKLKNGGK